MVHPLASPRGAKPVWVFANLRGPISVRVAVLVTTLQRKERLRFWMRYLLHMGPALPVTKFYGGPVRSPAANTKCGVLLEVTIIPVADGHICGIRTKFLLLIFPGPIVRTWSERLRPTERN